MPERTGSTVFLMAEAEQVFFNAPLLVLEDPGHSSQEPRFHPLGKSDDGRPLHITFTLRHAGEKLNVLIGPADSNFCEMMGGEVAYVFSIEENPALLGFVVAGDTVQQACLAGAIWADNGN